MLFNHLSISISELVGSIICLLMMLVSSIILHQHVPALATGNSLGLASLALVISLASHFPFVLYFSFASHLSVFIFSTL